jgi:protease-4
MSDIHDPSSSSPPPPPERPPLTVIPVPQFHQPSPPPAPPPPRGPSPLGAVLRGFFVMAFLGMFGLVVFLVLLLALGRVGEDGGSGTIYERYYTGDKKASSKIAIVKMEGVIMEGMTAFVQKQIDEAARDDNVKAIVLRVNSPGGSITASDDLHRRLIQLRDGKIPNYPNKSAKPLVVSMGALCASGGYYISMPSPYLFAEPTTITGSIGVYASFPNISELASTHGVTMNVIKAGEVKDSGNMFKKMTPQEQQLWQDMVDHAFDQFLDIVAAGRPNLPKEKLREPIPQETRELKLKKEDGKEETVTYTRRRADGGIYTADKAKVYGLIDEIGYLDDAVKKAASLAGLGSTYRAVSYERPPTLMDVLTRGQSATPASGLGAGKLSQALTPRMWYLAPQSELAGLLSAAGAE